MGMIYALGDVSGAHFNPAVTLAIKLTDVNFKMWDAGVYACTQVVAGVCAACTFAGIACTFPFGPVAPHGWAGAAIAEMVFTCVLCFVVLAVACSKRSGNAEMFGFAIGSCVTVGGFAIGSISGGSLNPAVSIGLAFASLSDGGLFYPALYYTLYELLGASMAVGLFRATHAAEAAPEALEDAPYVALA